MSFPDVIPEEKKPLKRPWAEDEDEYD